MVIVPPQLSDAINNGISYLLLGTSQNDISAGQSIKIGSGGATVKVAVHVSELQSLVTIYSNDKLAPAQSTSPGRAGIELLLEVALHPPVKENPAVQAL